MKVEIIQDFKGNIGEVEILNKDIFFTIVEVMEILEDNELKFDNEFINELNIALTLLEMKSQVQVDYSELVSDLSHSIEESKELSTDLGINVFTQVNTCLDKLN